MNNRKTTKKTSKSTKQTRLRLSARGRIMLTFAGMILASIIISNLMTWFDSYDGLGNPETIPESPYDSEKFRVDEKGRIQYEDNDWISRTVVDVSSYQKEINWDQVAADGVEMAMIRLGYRGYSTGLLNLDQCYKDHVKGAHKAGLDVGAYFFSQAVTVEEAEEEARFVLRHIRGKHVNGPIAFDMEPIAGADRITHLTTAEKTAIADAFCQLIEKNGHQAVVYGNPAWLTEDLDMSLLTDHDVWLAHYTSTNGWELNYTMWQYTDCGSVTGIEGSADLSVQMREKKYLVE